MSLDDDERAELERLRAVERDRANGSPPTRAAADGASASTPAAKKGGAATGIGCLAVLVVFIVIVVSCTAMNSGDDSPSSGDALYNCHEAVKAQVKNPDSIDWHTLDTTITDDEITGTLDAQNDFGATKSLSYTCEMDSATGEVTDAQVSEG